MGEIDTTSIEPVQVALSLFGQKKSHHTQLETEKERDFEELLKDLATCKLQLEAKDSAYNQALLKHDYNHKISEQLYTLLNESEAERKKNIEENTRAASHIDELESKLEHMAHQLSETSKIRDQLLRVLNQLKAAQDELFSAETQLASARDVQFKAITQAEFMESAAKIEKEKAEELSRHVSELEQDIHSSKMAAIEAEKVKNKILSEKDDEIEDLKKQLEMMEDLENQLLARSIFANFLELQLKNDLIQLKADIEVKESENSDQAIMIEGLVMELRDAKEEIDSLKSNIEVLTDELGKAKCEMDEVMKRESDAEVELALLKSELHRGRSKVAAVEAAELRVKSIKSGLYRAVEVLAVEAEKAKMENQKLKQGENSFLQEDVEPENITISVVEYESLIRKAEKAEDRDVVSSDKSELENLKKEMEVTMMKIGEFRNRAEQANTRAEAAEKAKGILEDQLRRRWQEQKEKRKDAVRDESAAKAYSFPTYEKIPATYQPLGKVLNMKF